MAFVSYLHKAVNRENLSAAEAQDLMDLVLAGSTTTAQLAAFLVALRMKGESTEELVGFARAMRSRCLPVQTGITAEPLLDTCGTGGDAACTFNISTAAAFVVAGTGVKVAKHGNRSISSACGSADIMEALGVRLDIPPALAASAIREVGIGFLFAPAIHPAMKHAQPARAELKMRTAFNLLGPLTNPANATVQIAGAPSVRAAELMAEALATLGLQRGFVVHGLDGLDEITTTGGTLALEIRAGAIAHRTLSPEDFGVPIAGHEELKGGGLEENLRIIQRILANEEKGPKRDIVVVNAAAALVAAGTAETFLEGAELARKSINSGAAMGKVEALAQFTSASQVTA